MLQLRPIPGTRAVTTSPDTVAVFSTLRPADVLGPLKDVERKFAPELLYLAGDSGLLVRGPRVAVVGSRKATADGLRRAAALTRALVQRDIVVVSGLAAGIDTAAHSTALESGGRTIAVLGTPLDLTYPKENAALQQRLAREQLVVSQFAPGTAVTPKNFPIRNRTMALLTDATVIVEAGENSGSVQMGRSALALGRPVGLLRSVVAESGAAWVAEFIERGAFVLDRSGLASWAHAISDERRFGRDRRAA